LPHQSTVFRIAVTFQGNKIKNPELLWRKVEISKFANLFCLFSAGAAS
jgi:hypothetical protein